MIFPMLKREVIEYGSTIVFKTGCGNIFITCNYREKEGKKIPLEVFIKLGKAGGCPAALLDTIARLISWHMQSVENFDLDKLIKKLKGVKCPEVPNCVDSLGMALEKIYKTNLDKKEDQNG